MFRKQTSLYCANLPQGVYKATVYGDGATGAAFGSTPNIGIIPTPKNFDVTNITTTTARAAWSDVPCAKYYTVQYRVITAVTFTTRNTKGNVDTMKLSGLMPNTTYIAHVAAADSANATIGISKYSVWDTFTTAPTFMARNFNSAVDERGIISEESKLSVYPNPARNIITIKYEAKKDEKLVNLSLMDITGRVIWTINKQAASSLNNMQRNVSELKPGVYLLNISKAETGAILQTTKVVVQK